MKKIKVIKPLAVLTAAAVIVSMSTMCAVGAGAKTLKVNKQKTVSVPKEKLLTGAEIHADAFQMVKLLEDIHPVFIELKDKPKGYSEAYEEAKAEYWKNASKAMTKEDFALLTSKFLNVLNDGHTHVYWDNDKWLCINLNVVNNKLVTEKGYNIPEGAEVLSIGGIPVDKIIKNVDMYIPAENQSAQIVNHSKYTRQPSILKVSGVKLTDSINVLMNINGKKVTKAVKLGIPEKTNTQSLSYAEGKREGNTYVFTLRSCTLGHDLDKTIDDMKAAVADGVNNVIIDVRNNGGGNSDACQKILEALGMEVPEYGCMVRYSPEAAKQNGYPVQNGVDTYQSQSMGKANSKINLYVLTNRKTFSSATMLAVWTSDGKLGKVIGQPSANSPSSYGDIINFKLDNSGIIGSIAHKKFIRPDASKDSIKELVPDTIVPDDKDALNVVMDMINGK